MADTESKSGQSQIQLVVENPQNKNNINALQNDQRPVSDNSVVLRRIRRSLKSMLTRFHAGYFRISLSLGGQALLWKTMIRQMDHQDNTSKLRKILQMMLNPNVIIVLWSLALITLVLLSVIYLFRCWFYFKMVKLEFVHYVGVNYLFVPWISSLLLLESAPFVTPDADSYLVLWWVFAVPVFALDVKIYGQWFTRGKRFLSAVANPTSQMSVIGNLVGAHAAANMGWRESAVFLFSLGMVHYLVLFVTLYQRLSSSKGNTLPAMLRPVFFLFFAAPSVASLAWEAISGDFDTTSKMLFFLSLFLFTSLVINIRFLLFIKDTNSIFFFNFCISGTVNL